MATIRKRNGKFQAQIRRKGFKTISRTFTLRRDAIEWARETELKADRRGMPANLKILEQTTLEDILIRYRDTIIPNKRSPKNETIIINAFLKHDLCRRTLAQLNSNDFEQYKLTRLKTVKGSTINREFNIIRHALNTAINLWDIPLKENPLVKVQKAPTPQSRDRRLTKEEYDIFFKHVYTVGNKYVPLIIGFALETGMRRSEILRVEWQHVDIANRTLNIPITKTGYPRIIPLTNRAVDILYKVRKTGKAFPVKAKTLEYHWRNICNKSKTHNFNFHDLRHEAISRFFEKGLSIPEVALISGHKSYAMLSRYTHLKAEDVARKL